MYEIEYVKKDQPTYITWMFGFQFSSKQLERYSKKAEKEQAANQAKVKKVNLHLNSNYNFISNNFIRVFDCFWYCQMLFMGF